MTAWMRWLVHRAEWAAAGLRLRTKVLALVCTSVAPVILAVAVQQWEQSLVRAAYLRSDSAIHVAWLSHRAEGLLQEAEVRLTAYQLTGRHEWRSQYQGAATDVLRQMDVLARHVGPDQSAQSSLAIARRDVERTLETLDLQFRSGGDPVRAPFRPDPAALADGKRAHQAAAQSLRTVRSEHARVAAEQRAKSAAVTRWADAAAVVAVALGVFGGFAGSFILGAGMVKRIHRLRENAQRLAVGEALPAASTSSDEIGGLERSIEQTAVLLAERAREVQHTHDELEERVRSRTRDLEADIAARTRMETQLHVTEGLLRGMNRILEMVALDMSLPAVLEALVDLIDTRIPGSRGSIQRVSADGRSLRSAANGRLPPEYCKEADGLPIGPDEGCCGTAAYRREPVVVEDIATDPLWQRYAAIASHYGLRSGWSIPILDGNGRVLGTFAVYGSEPHRPSEEELEIVRQAAHMARIAFERHDAVDKLRSQADRFRALIENVSDAVTIIEADGTIRYETPGVTRVLGYQPDERVGQPAFDFLPPADVEAARQVLHHIILQPGLHFPGEWRMRSKDGGWRTMEFTVNNLLADPDIKGLVATARDVSERHTAQVALIASEQRYRELFENASEIIYTHDLAGRITSLNKAAELVLGYPRGEALGKRVWDVVAPEYHEKVSQMIGAKIGGEAATQYEIEALSRTGARIQLEVSSRLTFENGRPTGVQGIARNVTERRELEHQLRQAQKMEAIGRLAGGVAHDFNNLLTVITGYTQWILDELEPESPLRESATETLLAAHRAASLTSQLLAFSRHQIIQPAEVDLNEVVASLDRMLRRIIGEDIELVSSMSPSLGLVRADAGQIGQVVTNLVVNARDAMPEGGSLVIETANVELDARYCLAHPECRPGPYVMLAVSDSGVGMDAATLSRVFEPFFTTRASGTGLGLSTVYGIVKQSGGSLDVYSEVGAGAVFKVYLPRIQPEVPQTAAEYPGEEGRARGNESILLVEDESGVRRMVREMLQRQGYQILEAADGSTAERLLIESAGPVHLLLSDVVMPDISGTDLAARLQALRPDMKVLFMSGYTDDAIFHRRMLTPGSAFLQKPFTPDTLASKVREVLDSR